MTYKGGLIAYVYPLLPSIYTQNRDIIDWYITELLLGHSFQTPLRSRSSINTKSILRAYIK
jgi:hypothetical protein